MIRRGSRKGSEKAIFIFQKILHIKYRKIRKSKKTKSFKKKFSFSKLFSILIMRDKRRGIYEMNRGAPGAIQKNDFYFSKDLAY